MPGPVWPRLACASGVTVRPIRTQPSVGKRKSTARPTRAGPDKASAGAASRNPVGATRGEELSSSYLFRSDDGSCSELAPGLMFDNFLPIPDAQSLPFYPLVLKLVCVSSSVEPGA